MLHISNNKGSNTKFRLLHPFSSFGKYLGRFDYRVHARTSMSTTTNGYNLCCVRSDFKNGSFIPCRKTADASHVTQLFFKSDCSLTWSSCIFGCFNSSFHVVYHLNFSFVAKLVLQLDFCGRCSFDDIICNSLAQSSNSLPCLGILSLRGAGRLSDNTLKPLLVSAPMLQSINLGQCALLTCDGIKILADSLKTNLKELYIDDCLGIDAMRSLPSMKKFKHLEVLSVAGILSVCDRFISGITAACGGNLKELNLANCMRLTDRSLEAIGNCCPRLCLLNISNLNRLTDLGVCYLANGCKSLESLDVSRAELRSGLIYGIRMALWLSKPCILSDEAVAAFLETSGGSLKVLSLNHVRQISFNTAFSLAKRSRKLVGLDLSWCRRITDEALGYIIDNCSSLELLKIFGCTQITDGFLFSYSNSRVRIVGCDLAPLLEHANMFEPVEVLLHHSPLLARSDL